MDVKIGEVSTELVVTEGVGSLSPDEVKRLVAIVLEHIRQEQDRAAQQQRDTAINDRVFSYSIKG
jgi:hypothetical protein